MAFIASSLPDSQILCPLILCLYSVIVCAYLSWCCCAFLYFPIARRLGMCPDLASCLSGGGHCLPCVSLPKCTASCVGAMTCSGHHGRRRPLAVLVMFAFCLMTVVLTESARQLAVGWRAKCVLCNAPNLCTHRASHLHYSLLAAAAIMCRSIGLQPSSGASAVVRGRQLVHRLYVGPSQLANHPARREVHHSLG